MKTIFQLLGLLSVLLPGCSDHAGCSISPVSDRFSIQLDVPGNTAVDTAQVFFFKKRLTTDTLIYTQAITGVHTQFDSFNFKVPAGYYRMVVLGNVDPGKIGPLGASSSSDMLVEYTNGEPPVLYYGSLDVNVGEERTSEIGLTLTTSQVVLALKEVPFDAYRIDMTLSNTGAGMFLDRKYINETVTSPLFKQLDGILADSDTTFIVTFSCFPTISNVGRSVVNVKCYDGKQALKYSGESSPFTVNPGERLSVACTFDVAATTVPVLTQVRKTEGINLKLKRVNAGHL